MSSCLGEQTLVHRSPAGPHKLTTAGLAEKTFEGAQIPTQEMDPGHIQTLKLLHLGTQKSIESQSPTFLPLRKTFNPQVSPGKLSLESAYLS